MLRETDSGVKDQRDIIKQPGVWAAVVVGAGGQSIDTTKIMNLGFTFGVTYMGIVF